MAPPPPDVRPLRPASAVLLALVAYLSVWMILYVGLAVAAAAGMVFVATALALGPLVAVYVGLVRYAPHLPTRVAVGMTMPRGAEWGVLALAVVAGVGLAPGAFEAMNRLIEAFPPPADVDEEAAAMMAVPTDAGSMAIILVTVLFIAPAANELLFRGLILGRMREARGAYTAFMMVTLLSGLRAGPLHGIPSAMVVAAALTAVGLRSRTVWPCLAAHVAHTIAMGIADDVAGAPAGETSDLVAAAPLPMALVLGGAALAVTALAAAWRAGRGAR